MKNQTAKIFFISSAVCLLALTGCTKTSKISQSTTQGSFESVLAAQSTMKEFKNADELKRFFEHRSPSSAGSVSIDSAMRNEAVKESAPTMAPAGLGGGNATSSFSKTNIQVEGVDESDLLKTDGNYIYAITDRNLVIVKAETAGSMAIASTTVLDSRPQELYVNGSTLIVFGYDETVQPNNPKMIESLRWRPGGNYTFLSFYDISDRAAPKLQRRLSLEGGYTSSRLIGRRLYFITANYQYYPLDGVALPRVMENDTVISSDKTTDKYIYPSVYYIDSPSNLDATTVSVFDLDNVAAPLRSQVYMMPAGQTVYASNNALYLAYTKYLSEYQLRMAVAREVLANRFSDIERSRIESIGAIDSFILSDDEKLAKINQIIEGYLSRLSPDEQKHISDEVEAEFKSRHPNLENELEKTIIQKIALSGDDMTFVASGEVSGHLLNQYSLDEHNGYLRLATTRGQSWMRPFMFSANAAFAPSSDAPSVNNVYVLDSALNRVGSVENLAKGERIYSVRFMGNRAYMVTFKQTDPLFAIDLQNPEKPAVLGELKIPGFSSYLHPYDENTLIGIGKDVIDKGDQGVDTLGLKVSLFDVKDPSTPKEVTSLIIGGRGSDSSALYDYKAVLFDKEKGLLAIPASLTAKGTSDYQTNFQGVLVFRVSASAMSERGRVAFRLPSLFSTNQLYVDDTVRRNAFIGDVLYSFSPATLKSSRLDTLAPLGSLNLPAPIQSINSVQPAVPYVKTEIVQ